MHYDHETLIYGALPLTAAKPENITTNAPLQPMQKWFKIHHYELQSY